MLDPESDSETRGLILPDADRHPSYARRGETMHLNPNLIAQSLSEGDVFDNPRLFEIVTTPALYAEFGAEPAGESPHNTKPTPVDLLIPGLQHTMLHEVSFTPSSPPQTVANFIAFSYYSIWTINSRKGILDRLERGGARPYTARDPLRRSSWYNKEFPLTSTTRCELTRLLEAISIAVFLCRLVRAGYWVDAARGTVHRGRHP